MTRDSIGATVAGKLYVAEAAVDAALAETACLVASLPAARAQAHLSAVAGQKVFESAAGAVVALTEARARLVETHCALAALARRMGLDVLAVGPMDKPEDRPPIGDGPQGVGLNMVNKTLPSGTVTC